MAEHVALSWAAGISVGSRPVAPLRGGTTHIDTAVRAYVDAGSGIYILLGILAVLVGKATEKKGRNGTAWTSIAIYFGLIIPAIIVAIMGPNKPTEVVVTLPETPATGRK